MGARERANLSRLASLPEYAQSAMANSRIFQPMLTANDPPIAVQNIRSALAKEGMTHLSEFTPCALAGAVADHAATWASSTKADALK